MKNLIAVLAVLSLGACGGAEDSDSGNSRGGSTFKATVGTTDFEEAIRCEDFDSVGEDLWEFSVYNGKEPGDVNVQGLFKSGSKQEISLTIRETTEDGYRAISAAIEDFSITASGITGSGISDSLVKQKSGTNKTDTDVPITFEVTCR